MLTRASLRLRLMLIICLSVAALCTACGAYIVQRARQDIRGEVYAATALVEHYLDARIILARDGWRANPERVPTLELGRLSDVRHVDVLFYNAVGRLLERSGDGTPARPAAPAWFLWLIQRDFTPIPEVHHFVTFDGLAVGMLRIRADPAFEVGEIWNVARGVIGLLVVFGVLVSLLVWWAVGRALEPLRRIRIGLNELAEGRHEVRLPELDPPELGSIGQAFNRMAEALDLGVKENRRLTGRLREVQAEERARIARELHDEIGQCVTAIHADAASIRRAVGDASALAPSAAAIIEAAARIKLLVRDMLRRLRPEQVQELGLGAALAELVQRFRQRNPATECVLEIEPDAGGLRGDSAEGTYRIVQEALTNIARHARARRVRIQLGLDSQSGPEPWFSLQVSDDGAGFDVHAQPTGFGIAGMRERLAALRGNLRIDSAPGTGTRLTARMPA
ncbi:MAG: HAMP domain-containing protein [Steroidobacteraceae bacterium]